MVYVGFARAGRQRTGNHRQNGGIPSQEHTSIWVLLDDGWSDVDRKNGTLRSFGADPSRFPKGLSHTVRLLKDEFGVKYVGVWQVFQGYWNGVDPNGEAIIGRHEGLDTAAVRHFGNALINCMGMVLENYWHRPVSPIVRSSDDYLPHNSRSLAEHVMQNAFNALLMGELYHCDWDMFWSEHPHAWAHGIMRLLSGGPVYCFDAEGHTDERMLHDLLDFGGGLARPDAPGLPTADSLLRDPRKSAEALGVHARFGDRDVTAYVGLCEEHEQEVRLAARRPGRVIRPESGDVRPLQVGETMSTSVSHGEVVIFEE